MQSKPPQVRPTSSQAHYALTVWYHQREPAVQEGFPTQLSAASLRSDLATPAEDKKAKNRQKKKKKKKKKADAARTPAPTAGVDSDVEDASDSSEDNWMVCPTSFHHPPPSHHHPTSSSAAHSAQH